MKRIAFSLLILTVIVVATGAANAAQGARVMVLSGGTLNGQPVDADGPMIEVHTGDPIVGELPIRVFNPHDAGAVFPVGATVTWGERTSQPWEVAGHVRPGWTELVVKVNKRAPRSSGRYYILVATAPRYNIDQVLSGTTAGRAAVWHDGNDLGWDWHEDQFNEARGNGFTTSRVMKGDGGYEHGQQAANAIVVHVTDDDTSVTSSDPAMESVAAGNPVTGLPRGVTGVLLKEQIGGLPTGIIVESIFHRSVNSPDQFRALWDKHKAGAQILVGYWERPGDGTWTRKYRMAVIPEYYRPAIARSRVEQAAASLPDASRQSLRKFSEVQQQSRRSLDQLLKQSERLSQSEVAQEVMRIRSDVSEFVRSPEFTDARDRLLDSVTASAPVAQKILVRTVEKTTGDRDELVVNLAAATITGGASVGPLVIDNATTAAFEVLAEEGLISDEEARVLRGASTLIQALNGLNSADDVVSVIGAINDAYGGAVEVGLVEKELLDDSMRARVRAGGEVLDFVIVQAPADVAKLLREMARVRIAVVCEGYMTAVPQRGVNYEAHLLRAHAWLDDEERKIVEVQADRFNEQAVPDPNYPSIETFTGVSSRRPTLRIECQVKQYYAGSMANRNVSRIVHTVTKEIVLPVELGGTTTVTVTIRMADTRIEKLDFVVS